MDVDRRARSGADERALGEMGAKLARSGRAGCDDRPMENVELAWTIPDAAEQVGDGSPLTFALARHPQRERALARVMGTSIEMVERHYGAGLIQMHDAGHGCPVVLRDPAQRRESLAQGGVFVIVHAAGQELHERVQDHKRGGVARDEVAQLAGVRGLPTPLPLRAGLAFTRPGFTCDRGRRTLTLRPWLRKDLLTGPLSMEPFSCEREWRCLPSSAGY